MFDDNSEILDLKKKLSNEYGGAESTGFYRYHQPAGGFELN